MAARRSERAPGNGAEPYLYYLSAPSRDRGNPWLEQFHHDLGRELARRAALPEGAAPGFLNAAEGADSGRRERALAASRTLVPLYSVALFDDTDCGREWWYFAEHPSPERRILPVLWEPVPPPLLPEAARRLGAEHGRWGDRYARHGLAGLVKLSYLQPEYRRVVAGVARQLLLPEGSAAPRNGGGRAAAGSAAATAPDLVKGPSAFVGGDAPTERTLRILLLACPPAELPAGLATGEAPAYGDFASPQRAAELAAQRASALGLHSTTEQLGAERGYAPPGGPVRADEATLLLVDPWALRDPRRRAALSEALRSAEVGSLAVLVPWGWPRSGDGPGPDPGADLDAVTVAVLEPWWGRFRRQLGRPPYLVGDERSFEEQLLREIRRVVPPPKQEPASLSSGRTAPWRLLGPTEHDDQTAGTPGESA